MYARFITTILICLIPFAAMASTDIKYGEYLHHPRSGELLALEKWCQDTNQIIVGSICVGMTQDERIMAMEWFTNGTYANTEVVFNVPWAQSETEIAFGCEMIDTCGMNVNDALGKVLALMPHTLEMKRINPVDSYWDDVNDPFCWEGPAGDQLCLTTYDNDQWSWMIRLWMGPGYSMPTRSYSSIECLAEEVTLKGVCGSQGLLDAEQALANNGIVDIPHRGTAGMTVNYNGGSIWIDRYEDGRYFTSYGCEVFNTCDFDKLVVLEKLQEHIGKLHDIEVQESTGVFVFADINQVQTSTEIVEICGYTDLKEQVCIRNSNAITVREGNRYRGEISFD